MHLAYLAVLLAIIHSIASNQNVQISEYLKNHARKLHNLCRNETGVAEELVREGSKGVLSNDPLLQCYIHCLFQKVGLIDTNNEVHLEYIIEVLPAEFHSTVEHLADKCGTQHGTNSCETAYLTVKCYFETNPTALKKQLTFIFE